MISLIGLNVKLRSFALKDVNLTIDTGDYFMLVGPTGAGKTLLLETIAGLHSLDSGEIRVDGRDVAKLEPEKRGIGIVYQDSALFPHLSVADNIVFGLKVSRKSNHQIEEGLAEMSSLFRIGHLLERKPGNLSGGEKQKVALARSLIVQPGLLLLDEPLSALDPETREDLQKELRRINSITGITMVHVTHNFEEALTLAQHVAVIGGGVIRQVGTPEQVFRQPESEFVASFTMMRNIYPGQIVGRDRTGSIFRTGQVELVTASHRETASYACIRPEDITLSAEGSFPDSPNNFAGVISRLEDRGPLVYVWVDVPLEICCLVAHQYYSEMGFREGKQVKISLGPAAIHVF